MMIGVYFIGCGAFGLILGYKFACCPVLGLRGVVGAAFKGVTMRYQLLGALCGLLWLFVWFGGSFCGCGCLRPSVELVARPGAFRIIEERGAVALIGGKYGYTRRIKRNISKFISYQVWGKRRG